MVADWSMWADRVARFIEGHPAGVAVALAILLLIFLNPGVSESDLRKVDRMSGEAFEEWCVRYLRRHGFHHVRRVGGSGDHGADIIAWNGLVKYTVQCKCYGREHSVGPRAVQEANAAMEVYRNGWPWILMKTSVMTNRYFTKQAEADAKKCRVELWDRGKLRVWA